jgi:hypothetical protein
MRPTERFAGVGSREDARLPSPRSGHPPRRREEVSARLRGSDQECLLEENEPKAFARGTMPLRRPGETFARGRDQRHHRHDDGRRGGRRDLTVRRADSLGFRPLSLGDFPVAAVLSLDDRPGAFLHPLRATTYGTYQPVEPATEHHLPGQVHHDQQRRRERHRLLPQGKPPRDHSV